MKKKTIIALLLAGGIAGSGTATAITAQNAFKPTETAHIYRASGEEEPQGDTTSVDQNGNGIPDVIEDYYDKHIRDQYLFGISLGALIGLSMSIAAFFWRIHKDGAWRKRLGGTITDQSEAIQTLKDQVVALEEKNNEYKKLAEDAKAEAERYRKFFEEENRKLVVSFDEAAAKLSNFSDFNAKIDAILKNQMEIALNDPELIKSGVAEKLAESIKEVNE